MKTILPIVVVIGLLGALVYQYMSEPTTYSSQNETVVVEKEVEVDNLEKKIEDAQNAASGEIEAKAQAEYDAVYQAEMAKVKAQVLLEAEQEIEAQRLEVESQIQAY